MHDTPEGLNADMRRNIYMRASVVGVPSHFTDISSMRMLVKTDKKIEEISSLPID